MSDTESDTSFESYISTHELLERFVNLGVHYQSEDDEDGLSPVDVMSALQERYGNFIPITRELASTILEINSPYYNAVLNNQISFPFDVPLATSNNGKPIPDLMEHLIEKRVWSAQNFLEHTADATFREIPVYSGTIQQVASWSCQEMPTCLFEIRAQLIGIAQKNPRLSACKGNEIVLLIRDLINYDPVLQVTLPYFLYTNVPRIGVGQMISCVGTMMDTHLLQAVRVYNNSYVREDY